MIDFTLKIAKHVSALVIEVDKTFGKKSSTNQKEMYSSQINEDRLLIATVIVVIFSLM